MELDSSDPSMSTSDNDAVELGSTSTSDIEELYPSEREDHCKLNLGHDFVHKEISTSDSSAMYPSDLDDKNSHSLPLRSDPSMSGDTKNELDEISKVLVSSCCDKKCLFYLCAHDVITARQKFTSLGANAQRQWLTDKMIENSHIAAGGKLVTTYFVAGREVCQSAWCNVHSLSPKRVSRVLKAVTNGQKIIQHGNKGKKRCNSRSTGAKAWMERYFHLIGDKMPHNNQIHLPSWETQKDIYERYMADMQIQEIPEEERVAISTFYRIWATDFANVVIPEVSLLWRISMINHTVTLSSTIRAVISTLTCMNIACNSTSDSEYKSTVAALIVRGKKCVVN